jgi:hypothetical protein
MFAFGRLLSNSRFYILAFSVSLSLCLAGYVRIHVASEQLFYIRLEQVFGFVALVYWGAALLSGPFAKLIKLRRGVPQITFAHWAAAISAVYFTLLLAAAHIWLAAHAASVRLQAGGFVLLAILFVFVSVGATNLLARKVTDLATQKELWVTVFLCVWLFFLGLLLFLPKSADGYNSQTINHEKSMDMEIHHE